MFQEKLSFVVLCAIMLVAAVVFGMFYFIGYEDIFIDNPEFNSPRYTGLLLVFIYALVLALFTLCVASVVNAIRKRKRDMTARAYTCGQSVALILGPILVVCLVVTFFFASDAPLEIHGSVCTESFLLKLAGMFVSTILIFILLAVIVVLFESFGISRLLKSKRKRDVPEEKEA